MKQYCTLILLPLFLCLFLAIGCEEEDGKIVEPPYYWIWNVQVLLGTDTLYYLPGDSASTIVIVIVTDQSGNVVPHVRVGIALANPQVGILEFLDEELRDTTNSFGQVRLAYTCLATPGMNIVSATASGRTDMDSIAALPLQGAASLVFSFSRDSIFYEHDLNDSVRVGLCIRDALNNPIEGISFQFPFYEGQLTPLQPTDYTGCAYFWWHPPHETGWQCISYQVGEVSATACIWVEP